MPATNVTAGTSTETSTKTFTAVEETKQRLASLEDFIGTQMERTGVPGLAMAIVKDDEVIFSRGFGFRDVQKGLPVTPHTLFMIASVTKSFTAMSMGLLVDEGKLDWDTPVRRYLPEFRMHDPVATERLTPRDLGCHRSGLPRHDFSWAGATMSRQVLLERIPHLEPTRDLRTTWQYQNLMYATAGQMVGRVAGTTWEDFVHKRILTPLGMNRTSFDPETTRYDPLYANSYEKKDGGVRELGYVNLNAEATGPAGVMISSVTELVEWIRLHLNQGKLNGEEFVSGKTLGEMHKPHILTHAHQTVYPELPMQAYGLGWFVEPYRGHQIVHHGGNLPGFHSLITMMPDEHMGMVFLTNLSGNFLPTVLSYYIYDLVLGLNPVDWTTRFEQEHTKLETDTREHNRAIDEARTSDTTTSQPLESFTGEYYHAGYGPLSVVLEDNTLVIRYNQQSIPLTHYHYDQFEVKNDWFERKLVGTFWTNTKGVVDRLSLPLEPTKGANEIMFVRKG